MASNRLKSKAFPGVRRAGAIRLGESPWLGAINADRRKSDISDLR
jgi:hypothetical protein